MAGFQVDLTDYWAVVAHMQSVLEMGDKLTQPVDPEMHDLLELLVQAGWSREKALEMRSIAASMSYREPGNWSRPEHGKRRRKDQKIPRVS